MDKNSILMIVGVVVFLFVAVPLEVIGFGLGAFIGLIAIIIFIAGWAGKRKAIKAERIRAEPQEESS